jgi:hypothetical protein
MPFLIDDVSGWINQDCDKPGIVIRFAMQEEETGLGRDRDLNLISELESAATFEAFFIEKNPQVTKQLIAISRAQSIKEREIARNDAQPFFWCGPLA